MRSLRRGLQDRPERSVRLWAHVQTLGEVMSAERIQAYTSVPGEPETGPFIEWARGAGKKVAVPEDDVDPSWPDVVFVPGLAYTASGDRLGQGGGWYDRHLASVRLDCTTIGVCFHEQLLSAVPTEPHDIAVDLVVTERGPVVS